MKKAGAQESWSCVWRDESVLRKRSRVWFVLFGLTGIRSGRQLCSTRLRCHFDLSQWSSRCACCVHTSEKVKHCPYLTLSSLCDFSRLLPRRAVASIVEEWSRRLLPSSKVLLQSAASLSGCFCGRWTLPCVVQYSQRL